MLTPFFYFFKHCRQTGIITDPMTGEVKETLVSGEEGVVAFMHNETLCYQNTAVIKEIPDRI